MSQSKEPRYVQRDPVTREITGHFANPQPGYAEEVLPDDHAELVAFHARRKAARLAVSPHKAMQEELVAQRRLIDALTARVKQLERV